jgi:hypothetical protein
MHVIRFYKIVVWKKKMEMGGGNNSTLLMNTAIIKLHLKVIQKVQLFATRKVARCTLP